MWHVCWHIFGCYHPVVGWNSSRCHWNHLLCILGQITPCSNSLLVHLPWSIIVFLHFLLQYPNSPPFLCREQYNFCQVLWVVGWFWSPWYEMHCAVSVCYIVTAARLLSVKLSTFGVRSHWPATCKNLTIASTNSCLPHFALRPWLLPTSSPHTSLFLTSITPVPSILVGRPPITYITGHDLNSLQMRRWQPSQPPHLPPLPVLPFTFQLDIPFGSAHVLSTSIE